MNYYDLTLLVLGLSTLLTLYIFHGRKFSTIHPVNVTILTVLFEFYGKYIWIAFGEPLTKPGLPYTNALFFLFIFSFFLNIFLTFLPFKLTQLTAAVLPIKLHISISQAVSMIISAFAINAFFAIIVGGSPLYGLINPIEFRIFMQRGGMFYIEFFIFFLLISGLSVVTWHAMSNDSLLRLSFIFPYFLSAYIALNTGLRGRFVEVLLTPIIIYALKKNRLPIIPLAMLGFLIVPFVSVFGMYRDAVRGNSLSFNEVLTFVGNAFASSSSDFFPLFMHRFDAFDNFVNVIESAPKDFFYLQSIVDFLSQPIPRSIWPTKANNFTSEMTLHYRPDLFEDGIALTYSAFSEAYMNFGFVLGPIALALYIYALISTLQMLASNVNRGEIYLISFCLLYQLPFIALSAGFINDVASVLIILTLGCVWVLSFIKRLVI